MTREWKRNWIVFTAVIVHSFYGIMLFFSLVPMPLKAVPLAAFPCPSQYGAAMWYVVASMCATAPLIWIELDRRKFLHVPVGVLLLIPQQHLLMLSAWTSVMSGISSLGQAWAVVGMFMYTASQIDWHFYSKRRSQ